MKRSIGLCSTLVVVMILAGCAGAEKKDAAPAAGSVSEAPKDAAPAAGGKAEGAGDKKAAADTRTRAASSPAVPKPIPAAEAQKTEKTAAAAYLITTKNGCNVRSQPNGRSKVLTNLKKGQKLLVLDQFEDWYNVKVPSGKTGWIHKELVKDAE